MATQYLSKTGLTYLWGRITALYQPKEAGKGLSTNDYTDAEKAEVAKIAGLVATGGEPNTIETVKVNDFALTPDAQKAVNIHIAMNGGSIAPDEYGYIWIPAPRMTWGGDNDPYRMTLHGTQDTISFDNHANGIQIDLEREHSDSPQTVSYSKVLPDETRVNALISAALAEGIGGVTQFRYLPVDALPATGEAGVIYLVPNSGSAPNIKDEYIWINKGTTESPDYAFELLGTTEMDLSGYLQTTDVEAITTAEIDEITGAATP